jgi:hypothetical protein
MFLTYISKILVDDHQQRLRYDTRGRRLGRAGRRTRRHGPTSVV